MLPEFCLILYNSFSMNKLRFLISILCCSVALAAEIPPPPSGGNALTLHETAKSHTYTLAVQGNHAGGAVILAQEFLSGKISTTPCFIREDNLLGKRQQEYPILELNFDHFRYGEPVTLTVLPCDRTRNPSKPAKCDSLQFVPKPLITHAPSGVHASCELADDSSSCYRIKISGLQPEESISLTSSLFGETKVLQQEADDRGEIDFFFLSVEKIDTATPFELTVTKS